MRSLPLTLVFVFVLLLSGSGIPQPTVNLSNGAPGTPYPVYVRGKVYNDQNGSPIRNHAVEIAAMSLGYSNTRYTDNDGWYSDTIPGAGPGHTIVVSTLDCHQVIHTQSFLSIPTVVTINFAICDSVVPVECHALFTPVLDSLNREPNSFRFFDQSSGSPNHWYWTFGDGSTSLERNPQHKYNSSGTYSACLYITREEGGVVSCLDSLCKTIITPDYRDLGGHLFAGELPINNPVSTGDTGVARIYRVSGDQVRLYDSLQFFTLGYFAFPHVLPGTYIIHASLTGNSLHAQEYFPMYYPSSLEWIHAEKIEVGQSSTFDLRIDLMKRGNPLSGPAAIVGRVTDGDLPGDSLVYAGAGVLLLNSDLQPLQYTTSRVDGTFLFEELPYGHYSLYADYPGKYSRYTGVSLASPTAITDTLLVGLFSHDVTALPENPGEGSGMGSVLPNPCSDRIHFSVYESAGLMLTCELYNLTGRRILSSAVHCITATSTITLPMGGISEGLYLLRVTRSDGSVIGIKKVIKK